MLERDLEQDKKGNQSQSGPSELVARQLCGGHCTSDSTQRGRHDSGNPIAPGDRGVGERFAALWLLDGHDTPNDQVVGGIGLWCLWQRKRGLT